MNRRSALVVFASVGLALPAVSVAAERPEKLAPGTIVVRGATVWTQGKPGIVEGADLLVRDGKIVRVGRGLEAPAGAHVIDAAGKHVTPGLIDCHSHTAIRGGVNEGSNNITAEVRIRDVIDPEDIDLYRQLAGGLTAAHSLHGSANSIGGQDAVIKLRWGATREALLVDDAWPGIKFALGENPKRSNFRPPDGSSARYPATRMGVMESIRERFLAARDYMRQWEEYDGLSKSAAVRREPPRRDLQLEAIAEILRGERKVHSHSYRQDEILALIRVAEEFGFTIATFQHVLEGYKVADEIAASGAGASSFSDWWAYKLEAYDAIPYNGALMHERGVSVTFNSDSNELARRMNLEAAKAVRWGGVDPQEALGFVTINAARQLGVDRRIGSLEAGKDADFVIWSGDPLSVYSIVEQTWVDGVREFDRAADLASREAVERERAERIDAIRNEGKKKDAAAKDAAGGDDKAKQAAPSAAGKPQPAGAALEYLDRLAPTGGAVSIVHATVHTMAGAPIENGTVSFRQGRIVEVGAGLAPLAGAEVVDAKGLHLYPGLIDANTAVGLTEISSVAGSVDIAETGDLNPDVNTAIAVNPDSELIPVTRAAGLTHVVAAPSGGLVSGTSALIRLDGWTWEDLAAARPVGLHVRWPSFRIVRESFFGPPPASEEDQKKEREERLEAIRDLFEGARAYARVKAAQGGRGVEPLEVNPTLESLLPVLEGKVPVIVHASQKKQLDNVLEWADKERLRIIIAGDGDVWRAADALAARRIPVILTSVLSLPERRDEPYDTAYAAAAKLHEAGVEFCIASDGSGFGASMTRNLAHHAAMAAAFGLPREVALEALTLAPARILGVGDMLGSIEVGKSASLILTDGDPLEIRTHVERAFIDGRPVKLEDNRHERLWRRYRDRPAPPPPTRAAE